MFDQAWIEEKLSEIRKQNAWRELRVRPEGTHNFSSNDYLGLSTHPEVVSRVKQAVEKFGVGAGASRLVSGTKSSHIEFEKELEQYFSSASLVYGSGYLANLGLLATVVGRNDAVILDKLSHATLIDGTVLSRANLKRFRHNDVQHAADCIKTLRKEGHKGRIFLVTESVFSMDGDKAPLEELSSVCQEHEVALVVDEAHALGVFGSKGQGLVDKLSLSQKVPFITATFSKALGSYGGVVVSSKPVKDLQINTARSFIYDTALPPMLIEASRGALSLISSQSIKGEDLLSLSKFFVECLSKNGIETTNTGTQIVPVLIGDNEKALRVSNRILEKGVVAVAIRPPTVPEGTSRIRFSITLGHTEQVLEETGFILAEVLKEEGLL